MKQNKFLLFALISTMSIVHVACAQNSQDKIVAAFTKSYTYEATGNYLKAIEAVKEAYLSDSYELNLRLAWLHYMAGLHTESMTYYQKCLQLMPMSIEARLGYVNPAVMLGNWETVIKQYNDILAIDSQHQTANYRLGYIYYMRKDYSKAYKYLEKCANLYPFTYDYVLMYAWTNYKMGKNNEAKILFYKALMLEPSSASAREGLSLVK